MVNILNIIHKGTGEMQSMATNLLYQLVVVVIVQFLHIDV